MNKAISMIFIFLFSIQPNSNAQSAALPQPPSLSTSSSASKIKISDKATGFSTGLKIDDVVVTIDTTIRVSPKTAYLSIDINGITGSSFTEILAGNNSFWIVDKNGKEVRSTERFLKKVGGSMESNIVNYTVKIPFRLKKDLNNAYTVRYVFESKDKHKTIDIVTTR